MGTGLTEAAVLNRQPSIANRQSPIANGQSPVGNRPSAAGGRRPTIRLDAWRVALALTAAIAACSAYFVFKHAYQPGYDEQMYLANAETLFSLEKGKLETWHVHYLGYSALIGAARAMFGLDRTGVKFLNLLMHCASCLLIFFFVRRRTETSYAGERSLCGTPPGSGTKGGAASRGFPKPHPRLFTFHPSGVKEARSLGVEPAEPSGVEDARRLGVKEARSLGVEPAEPSRVEKTRRFGAKEAVGHLAAPAAMLLAGCYPLALYMTGMILTETMFSLLLVAAAICLIELIERDRVLLWVSAALLGTLLAVTRPTGYGVAIVLSALGSLYYLIRRRSPVRALAALGWVPLYAIVAAAFFHVYAPRPPAARGGLAHWLLHMTYVTREGDSYDAVRRRQAVYARTHPDNEEIAQYYIAGMNQLEAEIMAELKQWRPGLPSNAEHLYQLPSNVAVAALADNFARHPGGVTWHFLKNALWNMWFIRDNLRNSSVLLLINLPYLILFAAGMALLILAGRRVELAVLSAIIFPLWGAHTLIVALSRYSAPFIPLFSLVFVLGASAVGRKAKERASCG